MRALIPSPAAALAILLFVSLPPGEGAPTSHPAADKATSTHSLRDSFPTPFVSNTISFSIFPVKSKEASRVVSATSGGFLGVAATFVPTPTFETSSIPIWNTVLSTFPLSTSKPFYFARSVVKNQFNSSVSSLPASVFGPSPALSYTIASTSTSTSTNAPSASNLTPATHNTETPEGAYSKYDVLSNRISIPTSSSSSILPNEISSLTYTTKPFQKLPNSLLTNINSPDLRSSDPAFVPIVDTTFTVSTTDSYAATSSRSTRPSTTRPRAIWASSVLSRSTRSAVTKTTSEAAPSETPHLLEIVIDAPRRRFSAIRNCSVGYMWIRGLCRRVFGATPTPPSS